MGEGEGSKLETETIRGRERQETLNSVYGIWNDWSNKDQIEFVFTMFLKEERRVCLEYTLNL